MDSEVLENNNLLDLGGKHKNGLSQISDDTLQYLIASNSIGFEEKMKRDLSSLFPELAASVRLLKYLW